MFLSLGIYLVSIYIKRYKISVIPFSHSPYFFKNLRFKEHKIEDQHKESRYEGPCGHVIRMDLLPRVLFCKIMRDIFSCPVSC
jgi:hypothetical protein